MIVVAPGRFIILLLQTDASYVRKQLPGPLVCLCSCTMNLADSLMSSWTISELLDIVRPLLGRRAENWTFELRNARLWLLQRRPFQGVWRRTNAWANLQSSSLDMKLWAKRDFAYQVNCRTDGTRADEFHDEVKHLPRLKTWTERGVQNLVAKLYGVSSIDARTSSPEAFRA